MGDDELYQYPAELRNRILWSAKAANFVVFQAAISSYDLDENWFNELLCQKSGDTVIHYAVRSGCLDILKYFNEECIDSAIFTRVNAHGNTPLHVAALEGSLDCTRFLLSLNVPVDPFKKGDWTPLMLACTRGHVNIAQELIEAGANPHLRNKDGWTAFHIAARSGCLDILRLMSDRDQSLCYTRSDNYRTPLHTAALHGRADIVDFLVESAKLRVDLRDSCGNIPLMDAVRSDSVQMLHMLLQKNKALGEALDLLGRNILHIAAESASNECLKYIIENRILDVNSQALNGGQTALHYSCKEGHAETVKLLLHFGIDYSIQDSKERTATDIADLKKHWSCVQEIELSKQLHSEN